MRPICIHCGKRYGSRNTKDEFVVYPVGTEMPRYQGNLQVVKTDPFWHRGSGYASGTIMGKPYGINDNIGRYTLWDGESYYHSSAAPFCTLTCALDYARKAMRRFGNLK